MDVGMLIDKLHTLFKTSQAAMKAAKDTTMKTVLKQEEVRGSLKQRDRDLRISKFLFDISESDANHVDDCQDQRAKGCGSHVVSDSKI